MAGAGGPAVVGRRALGRERLAARRPRRARGGRGDGERAGRLGGRAAAAGVRAGVAANMEAGAATGSGAGVAAPRGVVPPSWFAHRAPPFAPSTDGAAPGPGPPRSRAARGPLVRRPRARPSEAGRDRSSRSHERKDRPRPPYPSSPRRAPPSPRRPAGAGGGAGAAAGHGPGGERRFMASSIRAGGGQIDAWGCGEGAHGILPPPPRAAPCGMGLGRRAAGPSSTLVSTGLPSRWVSSRRLGRAGLAARLRRRWGRAGARRPVGRRGPSGRREPGRAVPVSDHDGAADRDAPQRRGIFHGQLMGAHQPYAHHSRDPTPSPTPTIPPEQRPATGAGRAAGDMGNPGRRPQISIRSRSNDDLNT